VETAESVVTVMVQLERRLASALVILLRPHQRCWEGREVELRLLVLLLLVRLVRLLLLLLLLLQRLLLLLLVLLMMVVA
jgi:hypothetical protein